MKIGNFRRIFKTDYPTEQQNLVEKLALTINNGFEVVYNALARNISLSDNIACTVKTLSVKVNSSGIPTSPLSFKLDTVGTIKGISVIRAENQTNSTVYVTSHPFFSYSQNDTTVTVNHVSGSPANNVFNITVVAWA